MVLHKKNPPLFKEDRSLWDAIRDQGENTLPCSQIARIICALVVIIARNGREYTFSRRRIT